MAIPDWITLSTTSGGNGTTQVTVSVTDSNYIERIKTLRVTSSPDSLQADVEINQNNRYCRVFVYQPTISAWTEITDSSSQYGVVVAGEGESNVGGIKVLSNIPWHIEYEGGEEFSPTQTASTSTDIVTFSSTSGTGTGSEATIYYSVPEYGKYRPWSRFSEYRIVSDNGEHTSGYIHFTQERYDSISASPSALTYEFLTQVNTFNISCHSDWSIVSYPSWLTLSQDSGFGNATVYATSQENTGVTRTGYIIAQLDYGAEGDIQHPNIVYINVTQYDAGRYYYNQYLTFRITGDGNIRWRLDAPRTLQYRKNGGVWTALPVDFTLLEIPVVSGDIVQFKGDNARIYDGFSEHLFYGTTCQFKVEGNIMSLLNSTDFANMTELTSASTFDSLFHTCTGLTDASNLVLPATTLTERCYQVMFLNCISLVNAPSILPATTLVKDCYAGMFSLCDSLTNAPELPATTLADWCYQYMFNNCTSLTNAPELPATNLAYGCYYKMFQGCTSLTNAPELPATALTEQCYYEMFKDCFFLTTAPELPATTLAFRCYESMFSGCPNLNYIKCLATNISAMGCTSGWVENVASSGTFVKNTDMSGWTTGVNGIPVGWTVTDFKTMPLTFRITSDGSINWITSSSANKTIEYSKNGGSWTSVTSSTGGTQISVVSGDTVQFRGNNATYAIEGCFSGTTAGFIAEGNIMSLINSTNFSGLTTLQSASTFHSMFKGCTGLTDASNLILPATTLVERCYQNMFSGCTNLTTAPELPATTLATYCYYQMFRDCASLTTAPALPSTTLATYCYYQMFRDCASLTTAPELSATTLPEYCYNGMFWNCSNLNYIKCLATDISAYGCKTNWVNGVASSGTFVKNPNMNDWTTGASGIPTNWTVVDAT